MDPKHKRLIRQENLVYLLQIIGQKKRVLKEAQITLSRLKKDNKYLGQKEDVFYTPQGWALLIRQYPLAFKEFQSKLSTRLRKKGY